jgi:hypothetical protein
MDLLLPGGTSSTGNYNEGGHAVTPNATEDDLIDALAALERGDVEYVILEDPAPRTFMQAAGDARSGYVLEYNDAQDDLLMHAQGNLPGARVTEALTAFLNRDPSWRTMFVWERVTY